jgi:hypothetical protein
MPGGFGRNSHVGWGLENPWGTAVAGTKWAELVGEKMVTKREREPRPVVRGLNPREGNLYDKFFGGGGSFEIEANYGGLIRLLEHLFGDASDTITQPDVGVRWVHTFQQAATVMSGKGLTVRVNKDVDSGSTPEHVFAGFKVNSMKFSIKPDQNMRVEVEGAAKDVTLAAASTPAFPTSSNYVAGHQLSVEIDDVVRKVDEVELTIDNKLDTEKRVVGSKNIDEPIRSREMVDIRGTITMDAIQADWSKLDAGTLFKAEFLHAGAALGTGNFRWDFTLLKCLVLDNPFTVEDRGIVKSVLPFMALEPVSGQIIQLAVHNGESAVG